MAVKTKTAKPYSRIQWETVRKLYRPRMLRAMQSLAADLRDNFNLQVEEPWEMDADNFWVCMLVSQPGRERVDISFRIQESIDYEGVPGGYCFTLDIVEEGGRILGGCHPFNYTPQVWCTSLPAIRERFQLVEGAIADGAAGVAEVLRDASTAKTSETPRA